MKLSTITRGKMISYEKVMEKLFDGKIDSSYDVPVNGGWLEIRNTKTNKREMVFVKSATSKTISEFNELGFINN